MTTSYVKWGEAKVKLTWEANKSLVVGIFQGGISKKTKPRRSVFIEKQWKRDMFPEAVDY